ncbi:asparagine synthase B [Oxynema aestuarii]|jgi:asparagine synthase (glutamine-hydrolysing)|uniref:asparagine synthase (glutamine-hydrolyzing) n=1 Tax=Oxynema aestuarii AP17 TaxID=2064643 RepID=A0A6H1TS24_9CYAN|nr:asparagine synthase B [Oxynema aestuarii]QIZ69245.1 asparagine synthase B [Oxynema aestuarii AP17]RMH74656.1 MAG: asparagine synthase B [Cyanobacteria bacterium J007]
MCGIAGIWGDKDQTSVKAMMDSLIHRGPDAEGMFVSTSVEGILGHRRLSIMDPEGGNQPIYGRQKSRAIVANGEIYNFKQLRSGLSDRYDFNTSSDTEAILHLYEESGTDVLQQIDGMYAFAIADGDSLFAARDPIGIKPLYYGEKDGSFLFASELKAIAPHCRNVREFPPGSLFHSDSGFSSFYSVPDLDPELATDADYWIPRLRETLETAVVKRLMSDVPLGAFLSGGLDSSLIAAIARQHQSPLHTFSVGIEGSKDLEAARLVSRHLDTIHHEYTITAKEVREKLPEIIYFLESYDQDLVRSAIPCYFTSRLAAQHVKVILTGEGADELFAGYTYYKDIPDEATLHRELRRSVTSLHNINLQRVDRLTMAHSIEGRVPFLDLKMIELGQRIPAKLKLVGSPVTEKWILRKTFEDLLPEQIVWRVKEQFDEGSGTVDLLSEMLASAIDPEAAQGYARQHPDANLRSPEECYYHQIFMDVFDRPEPILDNVARWSERPL